MLLQEVLFILYGNKQYWLNLIHVAIQFWFFRHKSKILHFTIKLSRDKRLKIVRFQIHYAHIHLYSDYDKILLVNVKYSSNY